MYSLLRVSASRRYILHDDHNGLGILLTITIDGTMRAGLLAVAFDLLTSAFIASARDPASLLDGRVRLRDILGLGLVVRWAGSFVQRRLSCAGPLEGSLDGVFFVRVILRYTFRGLGLHRELATYFGEAESLAGKER